MQSRKPARGDDIAVHPVVAAATRPSGTTDHRASSESCVCRRRQRIEPASTRTARSPGATAPPFSTRPPDTPPFDTPPFDTPRFGTPPFDTPRFGTPPFDTPRFGTPPFERLHFDPAWESAPRDAHFAVPMCTDTR